MLIGGTPTASVRLRLAGLFLHWLFVARTVKVLWVASVLASGVPERVPALERLRPLGRLPELIVHDQFPPVTPAAFSVWL